ncbi:MAG: YnbE family lipoprotein [Desulfobacterales bacterium]|nr:YnbE family lipoprotein [Desulfobacterales bacterium]
MIFKNIILFWVVLFCLLTPSCNTHHAVEVAPVEIKPIHITIDVNVRVEKALDDFFSDIDEEEENIQTKP